MLIWSATTTILLVVDSTRITHEQLMILIHVKQQAILLVKAESRSPICDLVHLLLSGQLPDLVFAQTRQALLDEVVVGDTWMLLD